jgi:REP element-mobilizing transposase RayT
MTIWRPDFDPDHLYFITTTAVARTHLFTSDLAKRLIVDSLDCMRLRGRLRLCCFVVMPNHVHLVVQCTASDPLAAVLRDFKKHTSERLIRQFRAHSNRRMLDTLAEHGRPHKQQHKVWENGYDARDVFSPGFLREKMTYIHNNPCQPHWHLAEHPEDYAWSSARYYLLDEAAIIPLDSAVELLV